jgi:cytochrome b involved in lipid metabolism
MASSTAQGQQAIEKTAIHRDEVAKHNTAEDCWVVLNGQAYDMTDFMEDHPGGAGIIMKYAGRDASRAFNPIHPKNIVDTLPESAHLGIVTPAEAPVEKKDDSDDEEEEDDEEIPDISQMVNVWDFETIAKKKVTKEGWAYLMSGADDEICFRENHAAFHRVMLSPKCSSMLTTLTIHPPSLEPRSPFHCMSLLVLWAVYITKTVSAAWPAVQRWQTYRSYVLRWQVAQWTRCMPHVLLDRLNGGSYM